MKKSIGIIVAIVVIVLIIIFATKSGQESEGPKLVSMTDGQNTVVVSDQDFGESVTVKLVTLSGSGYVVIHADADGSPGEVIGHSGVLTGVSESLVVTLDRASKPGETLYAMLHGEDDDDGVYSFPDADAPLRDSNDKLLVVSFQVAGPADDEAMAGKEADEEGVMQDEEATDAGDSMGDKAASNYVVTHDGSNFSSSSQTIKKGDSVTFRNESTRELWPASAFHPTHPIYPGSDIRKCGSAEASSIFDACKRLSQGETYTFTFNEAGSWKYHNHLSPSQTGEIIVE